TFIIARATAGTSDGTKPANAFRRSALPVGGERQRSAHARKGTGKHLADEQRLIEVEERQ
ncbi:hypothetical protein ABEV74_20225, partial [Paenibacillus cisolokensis]|uniref:hypothetical protein n=1 Tax=Paenibacillus cisolokensis TaxID=1658519 RepID=UPI003D27C927